MAVKKKSIVKKGLTKSKPVAKKTVKKATKKKVVVKKTKTPATSKKVVKPILKNKKKSSKPISKASTKKKAVKPLVKKKAVKKVVTKNKKAAVKSIIKKSKKVVVKKNTPKVTIAKVKKTLTKPVVKQKQKIVKPLPLPKVAKEVVLKDEKTKTVELPSTEKRVKTGVKTKKHIIPIEPQPIIEVSDFDKLKVKKVLISQPKPEGEKNPYFDLASKFNLDQTFRQFIKIEGLPVKDFRAQRIDILEHKAVILTSRMAVDHYFRMCNEMRVTVPETMKYFCINEATAYYLQKYIQYRKRKIFFGHQTIQDLVDVIRKNREEKFLLPAADVHKEKICDFLDAINIKYTKAVMYRTVSADLSDIKNLNEYDVLTFFTPAGIRSLKQNFPNFKQGNTRIACFGPTTANELKKHGYRLDIYAPNPKSPSMTGALEEYMKESNKR